MTDAEKRSLKCYLTNVLEPAHKFYTVAAAEQVEAKALAKGMCMYYSGKAGAFATAIADFKELFAEELAEVEHE